MTAKAQQENSGEIVAYKAFDENMQCMGYQYEVGKTYAHSGPVVACSSGFHSCENPLDVLNYYDLCDSRFAIVRASGTISRHDSDSKIASASLMVEVEIKLPEFITAAVKYLLALCKTSGNGVKIGSSGYAARIGSSGYGVKIGSSGNAAQIGSSGDAVKIGSSGNGARIGSSGYAAQIGSSGNGVKIGSSGDGVKIGSSGNAARIGSSGYGVKIGSSGDAAQIGSSGDAAQISSSGDAAQIGSSGDAAKIEMSGVSSIALNAGLCGRIKAGDNGCFALSRWVEEENRYRVTVAYVGENGILADTWYGLDANGNIVKV